MCWNGTYRKRLEKQPIRTQHLSKLRTMHHWTIIYALVWFERWWWWWSSFFSYRISTSLRSSPTRELLFLQWMAKAHRHSQMDSLLLDEIGAFYPDGSIRHVRSNKKEVIHVRKQPVPIRSMNMFYLLRQKWVKILRPQDACVYLFTMENLISWFS